MRKIIAAAAIALATPANAIEPADVCLRIYSAAHDTMEYRQIGGALPDLIETYRNQNLGESTMRLATRVTMDAYAQPRFSSPEYQERVISEFANSWYLACMQTLGD